MTMAATIGGGWWGVVIFLFSKKNAISPFFDASGNINISATIRIGQEIWCLLYAGFFLMQPRAVLFLTD